MECTLCGRVKSNEEFSSYREYQRHECKECRATEAREKYAERKGRNLCPLCGERPSMVSSCMCESCWFIRHGKDGPRMVWIEQGKKCPYTGTQLVPGHNMKFDGVSWVSKMYAVIAKSMDRDQFENWVEDAHRLRKVRIEPPVEEPVVESGVRFFTDEYYQQASRA